MAAVSYVSPEQARLATQPSRQLYGVLVSRTPQDSEDESPEDSGRRPRLLIPVLAGVAGAVSAVTQVVNSVLSGRLTSVDDPLLLVTAVLLSAGGFSVTAVFVGRRADRQAGAVAARSRHDFQNAAEQFLSSVEEDMSAPERRLEDEIAEVSSSLSESVSRLRGLSEKAEAFEAEVRDLGARAEAAKATASIHEDDARRIALLLGSETEARLRKELEKLTAEHNRQIDQLRRSGNRAAVWTFVGGVVLGTVGNVVVALLVG